RCALPPQVPPTAAEEMLRRAARFLAHALPLCRAHTVELYTRGLWERLVTPLPAAVLRDLSAAGPLALRRPLGEASGAAPAPWEILSPVNRNRLLFHTDDDTFSNVFCENSKKLIDVHLFALAAKHYSLSGLEVCTPLEDILEALTGDNQGTADIRTDEFMNTKKSHEVQVMSDLVNKIANYCGIKQVIDIGSGKGYLSSFLSMQYNLKVYGIDSSNSNTNGAHERNRKLKKHWRAYQSRGRANLKSQRLEKANDGSVESEIKCKAIDEKPLNNDISLQSQDHMTVQDLAPKADLVSQTQSESELSEEVLAVLNALPADAVEVFSSSRGDCRELCEEEKAQRKMASLKIKSSELSESNLYSPLTSCITAETELSDIITDLEDCVMVGLHTCGDLAANTLRIFAAKPEIKAVCSVGCCYHLLSEQFENQ
ncbi:MET25 protein, partial [Heliornis fulica]|nr:MET25 protein [Heliornis fulica]